MNKLASSPHSELVIDVLVCPRGGVGDIQALARATARDRSERIISRMVVSGADVTEEQAGFQHRYVGSNFT